MSETSVHFEVQELHLFGWFTLQKYSTVERCYDGLTEWHNATRWNERKLRAAKVTTITEDMA